MPLNNVCPFGYDKSNVVTEDMGKLFVARRTD
jgi:hypothetical protein